MKMLQAKTSKETRAILSKLKYVYYNKYFSDEEITMTFGFILNMAFKETKHFTMEDWFKTIKTKIDIESKYYDSKDKSERKTTKFVNIKDHCYLGAENMTSNFTVELGLKVQKGFVVKQILKAALILNQ